MTVVAIMDGLNSLPWLTLKGSNGWFVDMTELPERDAFKYGYDLWSNGLAFQAFGIGRTYKVSIRAPQYGNGLWLLNFDTRGRLVNASYTGSRWGDYDIPPPRRELTFGTLPYPMKYRPEIHRLIGGTWLQATWVDRRDKSRLTYRAEIVVEEDVFYQAAMNTLDQLVALVQGDQLTACDVAGAELVSKLRKLPLKTHRELRDEAKRFHSILGVRDVIPVEPPELAFDHYHAIPVKTQNGCGGTCTFCSLYNRRIEVLSTEDVRRQIDQMVDYLGEEADHFTKVVLIEGDALSTPTSDLVEQLSYAKERFNLRLTPFAHAFSKANSITEKCLQELCILKDAGLGYINLGLESGCQELLDLVKPGQRLEQSHAAVCKALESEIHVSVNVIAGLGGQKFQERHVADTIKFARSFPKGVDFFYAPLNNNFPSVYAQQVAEFGGHLTDAEVRSQCEIFERELGAYEYMFIPM